MRKKPLASKAEVFFSPSSTEKVGIDSALGREVTPGGAIKIVLHLRVKEQGCSMGMSEILHDKHSLIDITDNVVYDLEITLKAIG
jgi:hypothetical protein